MLDSLAYKNQYKGHKMNDTLSQLALWEIDTNVLAEIKNMPDLPSHTIIWTTIYPGLQVPLQAIRHCYCIDKVTEDDIYMALTLPAFIAGRMPHWEYRPETDSILTTDKLLAACLKQRGRSITFNSFAVGLVYSEVMKELEHHSAKSLQFFTELMQQGNYFSFLGCTMEDGLKAISTSPEKGMFAHQNDMLVCKSFRVALELVNNTGRVPRMIPKKPLLVT